MRGVALLVCLGLILSVKAEAEPAFTSVHDGQFVGYILPKAAGETEMRQWYSELHSEGSWQPTNDQVVEAEKAIHRFLEAAKRDIRIAFPNGSKRELSWNAPQIANILKQYDRYQIQFVGITVHGQREIFCNYFIRSPSDSSDPARAFVMVFDGGSFYWQIIYVPATKS
jgi:hypothetical protein